MKKERLMIEKALDARRLSYSPYSRFAVGAAVLTKDGKVYQGANVENSSYPCSMCAERNALYHAYMAGYKREDLVMLAVAADTVDPVSPCGQCRQVISELFPAEAPIILTNLKGVVKKTTAVELLPFAFDGADLSKR
ncbi:MAG: cytidine deaminase [Bacilli bacterium]